VILLDGRGHHAGDANAVAAHGDHQRLAVFAEHLAVQRLRVLLAELEDVPHFDAALNDQRALTAGRSIAFHDITDVRNQSGLWQIATKVDAAEV